MSRRLSQHQACPALHVGLHLPFAHSADPLYVPLCVGTVDSVVHRHSRSQLLYPRGPRSGLGYSVPVHQRLIDLVRPTRRRIPISPPSGLYGNAFAVLVRLGDPRVVPGFRCHSFLACRPLRPRGDRNRFVPVLRFRRRPSPNFNWLGCPAYPAIRFPQGMNYRASWFAFATACQVARPLCGSDRITIRPPGLLLPGFQRVGHPSRCWI